MGKHCGWFGHGRAWQFGDRGDDRLSGGDGHDLVFGGRGDDQLEGGGGRDWLWGGRGDDVLVYRAGDGHDVFHGGAGVDTISLDASDWTLELWRGEVLASAADHLELSARAAGVLRFADGGSLRFTGVERIEGSPVNHAPALGELSASSVYEHAPDGSPVGTIAARDVDDGDRLTYSLIDDAGGRFAIDRASGEVTVADGALLDHASDQQHAIVVQVTDAGGLSDSASFIVQVQLDNRGDDTLVGTAGDDVIAGGDGSDLLQGGDGADRLSGEAGDDMLFGDDGDDVLSGGAGADQLYGGLGDDRLEGGDGADSLFGNAGDDLLDGGAGDDRLFGSLGDDVIRGGAGDDSLSGGSGADRYLFDGVGQGVDTISDFGADDVLAIGGMLEGFTAGREAEFVELMEDAAGTTVRVDTDGAAGAAGFVAIAMLSGIGGLTLGELVGAGQIDLAPA